MKDENQIDVVDETSTTEVQKESVGQILSSARVAQGISLEDLSEQIRVPMKVLVGIEADDIPNTLPETFIRGYIRSYAKKVGVEESRVLIEIETTAASSPDAMAMQSFSKRSKRKKVERRLTIISWLIFIILGSALVIWWYQTKGIEMLNPVEPTTKVTESEDNAVQELNTSELTPAAMEESEGDTKIEENADLAAAPSEAQADDFPASALRVQKPEAQQADVENTSVETTNVVTENPENTVAQNVNQEVAPATQTLEAAQQKTVNTDEEAGVKPVQSPIVLSDEEKRLLAENGEIDENDFIRVEFKFEQEVWVEVYDAYDERIAVGNKPAGYLMKLNAQGPFRVLLGSTYGVTIWVNDKEYDISEYPTNRVARFDIDTQQ
ncbi:cytoskeleton protein RodZ [Psychrosphaera haliotis]|uniref:RodZ domain-containing protein n=1 Tax=Psychrosphaera haliotis TaxID=555083 RepID=UPI0031D99ABA